MTPPDDNGRVREQLAKAGRYSRFVALMRWALPASAAILLLMLFVWPNSNGDVRHLPPSPSSLREMTNLHYSGLNARGEQMNVTAQRATQAGDLKAPIDLENVKGELVRKGNGWVRLESKTGHYDQDKNHVTLTGSVHLTDSDGYDVTTESAEIDLNPPAQAWGNQPVTGKGPRGKINGNGFKVTDAGKTVIVTGRARIDLPTGSNKGTK